MRFPQDCLSVPDEVVTSCRAIPKGETHFSSSSSAFQWKKVSASSSAFYKSHLPSACRRHNERILENFTWTSAKEQIAVRCCLYFCSYCKRIALGKSYELELSGFIRIYVQLHMSFPCFCCHWTENLAK